MTPEERFEAHEQWLLDHDKANQKHAEDIAEIHAILQQVSTLQRQQAAVVLDIAQHVARLDKDDDATD